MITFVVGPTATGKTDLAFQLAKEKNATILSADSRQVYKGLEITSGVDLPSDFVESSDEVGGFTYYSNGLIEMFGLSMLQPQQDWSVAQYRAYAEEVFAGTKQQGKDLIIVGGSGLFVQSLFLNKSVLEIPPNEALRTELQEKSVEELQQLLKEEYPEITETINNSDWNNPRRLIRWIEKLNSSFRLEESSSSPFGNVEDHTWIGLTAEKEVLKTRIEQRVKKRIEAGAIQEVERFINSEPSPSNQALSATGVKEIISFLHDQISKEELAQLWTQREFSFAKRQLTWFKKRSSIQWKQVEA